jgi:DNA-binding transcriptional MerR regulator
MQMKTKPNAESLVGTGTAAEVLGIKRHRLIALIDVGKLPEPTVRVPGRRLFSSEDIEAVRKALSLLKVDKEEVALDNPTRRRIRRNT